MGDLNQFVLVSRLASQLEPPFLEIGSKNYGSTQDLRSLLAPRGNYMGIDMEPGEGVDLVLDLTRKFEEIDEALDGERFGTIICLSVLEHCAQPFHMAESITKLLKPGGRVIVCVPFAWKFHGYPSDYWRFTHEGIKQLFPNIVFDMQQSVAASSQLNVYSPLDEEIGKISFSSKAQMKKGRPGRGMVVKILRSLGKIGVLSWLLDYRYLMAPTNIFMTGALKANAELRKAG